MGISNYINKAKDLASHINKTGTGDNLGAKTFVLVDRPPLDPATVERWLNEMNENFGGGPFNSQLQNFFIGIDKFSHNSLPPNAMHSGYTFITRPRLCLHDYVINKQSEFTPMDTTNYNSMQYAIRCLLDTNFAKNNWWKCKMLDNRSPFLTPLMNGLTSIGGYPDPQVETVTTDAGFHSEDQTYVSGYNQMFKTYDLSLDFRDPQSGPVLAIIYYWLLYMGYLSKGMMSAYMSDIINRRLCYTVSIYRFVVDPSKRYIMMYSKATGCFPKSVPLGAMFNFSDTERFIRSAGTFSIPFVANRIEYNRPEILAEFNHLVERYAGPSILHAKAMQLNNFSNYKGLPYISTTGNDGAPSPIEITFR